MRHEHCQKLRCLGNATHASTVTLLTKRPMCNTMLARATSRTSNESCGDYEITVMRDFSLDTREVPFLAHYSRSNTLKPNCRLFTPSFQIAERYLICLFTATTHLFYGTFLASIPRSCALDILFAPNISSKHIATNQCRHDGNLHENGCS